MHFVKKVPTTDEEKAVKQRERQMKMKIFCNVRDKVFKKRANGELDDELLGLLQKILEKNPDVYTYWNLRRETIEKKEHEWRETSSDSSEENISRLLDNELHLTHTCIEANPKSYAAWFQRGWVLNRHPRPNYKLDLALCEKALKMDCRNFHCWDHRRIVAKLAELPAEEELEFSNRLIKENFSNYSAWHYRAMLLPRMQAGTTGGSGLDDSTVVDEIKKVSNAFFTDPEDQCGWVYSRWLIEMGSNKEMFRPDSAHSAVPLTISFHGKHSTVVMSKPCTVEVVMQFIDSEDEAEWTAISRISRSAVVARIWQFHSSIPVSVLPNGTTEEKIAVADDRPWSNLSLLQTYFDINSRPSSLAIETMLKNCNDLMKEEPNNVWALYTITLCLIEIHPEKEHKKIVENLEILATKLDPMRKNIYLGLRDRQKIAQRLRSPVSDNDATNTLLSLTNGESRLSLRELGLHSVESIDVLAGLVQDLDLSGNKLESLDSFVVLPNLKDLILNENKVKRLLSCALPYLSSLAFLSVASCPIDDVGDTVTSISQLPALTRFVFAETALSTKAGDIKSSLGNREIRLIPYWM